MGLNNFFTEQALDAIFDKLEKKPIQIIGLDDKDRILNIWVTPPKKGSESH